MGYNKQWENYTEKYQKLCMENDVIPDSLFKEYGVNRGLRDINGNGVLTGLTNISRIDSFCVKDGKKVPCDGKLWYRGYNVTDWIRNIPKDSLGFGKTAYLLLFGKAPTAEEEKEFKLGHKLILLEMLAVLVWIVWGVTQEGYYIPEIASQFFVMGFVAGVTAIIFKLNGMTINEMAASFQSGVKDLAGTAVVVGMAKGILLVLGGSDATEPSALNTILHYIGESVHGIPAFFGAEIMYVFQSCFNLAVTSNSGQAALTMPIMAPLSDVLGIHRQIAVLAYQMGAGFVDAVTPVSAALIGVLGVAHIDWATWAKFQIKMQGFFFLMGTIILFIACMIGLQ